MTDLEFKKDMEFAYGEPRELAPGVARLVANNPSVFTFKGTNTYIIGTDDLAIIDPGPEDAAKCGVRFPFQKNECEVDHPMPICNTITPGLQSPGASS